MKRPEELSHMLTEMYNDTKDGKIHWNISVQTTENNEVSEKPVEVEDGVSWTIDECYVSYYCKYKGQDFLMITYEMIKTAGDKVHTIKLLLIFPTLLHPDTVTTIGFLPITDHQICIFRILICKCSRFLFSLFNNLLQSLRHILPTAYLILYRLPLLFLSQLAEMKTIYV